MDQTSGRSHGHSNPWVVLLVLCMGFFMILLDTTIVNIAIPSIIDGLHASLDSILWVLNSYILVYAVLLITAGRLGDVYGQRNLFAVGLVIFTAASAGCGLAQSPGQLIVGRVIQGVGGALLTPQTLAILTSIFPAERRGAAFGVWGAVAGVAAVTGPTLGGFLVSKISWQSIFYVNVPIGAVVLVMTFLFVPDLRAGRRHRLDVLGVALASAGLFGVVFGLIEGQRYQWGTIWGPFDVAEVIAAGVVIFAIFIVWERVQKGEPLVPLRIFRNRNFSVMNWVSGVMSFGMLGMFLPLTIYLQSVRGFSALEAGLTVAPMSGVSMLVAPFAGRTVDRIGGKYILMAGLTLFAAGMGMVAWVASVSSDWYDFTGPLVVAGLGMGCIFAPIATLAMRDITPQMAGSASGILNTTRQVGGAMGSALVGAVLQNRLASALHDQAVSYSGGLPPQFRQAFVSGFSHASGTGFQVGRGQTGGAKLPAGLPAQAVAQLQQLFHAVFTHAFVSAMRPTLAVAIVVLLVGAASCVLIQDRRRSRGQAEGLAEREYAAAGG
ncbi:MAG: DHA2 family efflux MFS transporter permease subunit [Candidatus Dormibacterales bacterium]